MSDVLLEAENVAEGVGEPGDFGATGGGPDAERVGVVHAGVTVEDDSGVGEIFDYGFDVIDAPAEDGEGLGLEVAGEGGAEDGSEDGAAGDFQGSGIVVAGAADALSAGAWFALQIFAQVALGIAGDTEMEDESEGGLVLDEGEAELVAVEGEGFVFVADRYKGDVRCGGKFCGVRHGRFFPSRIWQDKHTQTYLEGASENGCGS